MELFNTQYRLIFAFCSIVAFIIATMHDVKRVNLKSQLQWLSLFLFLLLLLFGLRGEEVGADTNAYIFQFENVDSLSPDREVAFYYLTKLLHKLVSVQIFLFIIAAFYLGSLYYYIKSRPNINQFLLFFVFFSMFFFKTLGINVVRQGVSLIFFLLAYQAYEKKQLKKSVILIIISLCWHTTTIIAIPLAYFSTRKINLKFLNISYFSSIVLAFANFGLLTILPFLSNLNKYDRRIEVYATQETNELYTVGFKPQFVLFNTLFLMLAYFIRKKIVSKYPVTEQKKYNSYIIYFTFSSMLFFMAFQIPYSDRIGLLSWIIIPLLMEPLLAYRRHQYATLAWTICIVLFITFEFILS
ncbi:EpsG family protein [Chryseobacterium taihuense]|uniref:EpsG family protein n=1 Tax=Chryseobacterium taihuense TaxID=1141221 RepID=A0ABY0QSQ5_9FLAO|nr:EpsG family protein [Chryseobacterium taihuense]SDL77210.1 EpsG family protein [Chryseobacterium taihuense]